MTTNKTMEERFDDAKYGWYYRYRASGFCFLREDEIKSFISQEIERAVREREEELREKMKGLAERIQDLVWQIEKCGASTDLTTAVIMAGEIKQTILSLLQEDTNDKE